MSTTMSLIEGDGIDVADVDEDVGGGGGVGVDVLCPASVPVDLGER